MRGIPLSQEQIDELLSIYRRDGYQAAVPIAKSFGIAPRYIARLARRMGYVNNYYGRNGTKIKKSNWSDPRWQWAIERGPVCV